MLSSSPSGSSSSSGTSAWIPTAHLLKYVVNPASYARLAADPDVDDPLTAADWQIAQYADFAYGYDYERRVTFRGHARRRVHLYLRLLRTQPVHRLQLVLRLLRSARLQRVDLQNRRDPAGRRGNDRLLQLRLPAHAPRLPLGRRTSGASFSATTTWPRWNSTPTPRPSPGTTKTTPTCWAIAGGSYLYLNDDAGLIHTYTYHGPTGWIASENIQEGENGDSVKIRSRSYALGPPADSSSSSSSSSARRRRRSIVLAQEIQSTRPTPPRNTKTSPPTPTPGTKAPAG